MFIVQTSPKDKQTVQFILASFTHLPVSEGGGTQITAEFCLQFTSKFYFMHHSSEFSVIFTV